LLLARLIRKPPGTQHGLLKRSSIRSSPLFQVFAARANMPTIMSTASISAGQLTRALSTYCKDLTKIGTARLNTMTTSLVHARRIHLVGLLVVIAHLRPAAGKRLNVLLIMVSGGFVHETPFLIFSTSLVSFFRHGDLELYTRLVHSATWHGGEAYRGRNIKVVGGGERGERERESAQEIIVMSMQRSACECAQI
jgi:hypothetical protein